MDPSLRHEMRDATRESRGRPGETTPVLLTHAGDGSIAGDLPKGAVELTLEATDAQGELAPWLDDLWWTGVIQRWCDDLIVVRFLPTTGAVLHPVVLYQTEMLRRVVPGWRVVAQAYVDDLASDDDINQIAGSAYHEVRFYDQRRPGTPVSDRFREHPPIEDLFGRIRMAQSRMYRTTPILARLPADKKPVCEMSEDGQPVDRARVGGLRAGVKGA